MKDDLSLVSTESLMLEVVTRFESIVIYGKHFKASEEEVAYANYMNGDAAQLILMCEVAKRQIIDDMEASGRNPEPWER